MDSLIRGETVSVLSPTVSYGEHMDATTTWEGTEVENVLVQPAGTSGVTADARPDGTRSRLTLHFPRGFSATLRGCRVVVRGRTYEVVGDPAPYEAANCPGPWWYEAEAARVDG